MRILVIEDEREIAEGIEAVLIQENYLVDTVYDGLDGLDYIFSNLYDLVLLDIMLPKIDGLDVLKNVREAGIDVPIILVTAKSQTDDIVTGLDLGADDYLTKPFDVSELLARIRARTRVSNDTQLNILSAFDLVLDKSTRKITCGSNAIKLGNKEYQLAEYFIANAGRILTKDMLVSKIWGPSDATDYNNVEVYVSFLRKKLKFLDSHSSIVTTKGVGYSLEGGEDIG